MILYFSATGNSKALATALSETTHDTRLIDLALYTQSDTIDITLSEGEALGLVFPIYGWSLPNIIKESLRKIHSNATHSTYTYVAVTCGDDCGMAETHIRQALRQAGLTLHAAFSVNMPDCYICLPGFDVDPDDERQTKLGNFRNAVQAMATAICNKENVFNIKRGALPRIKTYVLGGLFRKFLITPKPFHSTNTCSGCGKCASVCPLHNIKIADGHPQWGNHCETCLACYHHCPTRAIRFGRFTDKKGQYLLSKYREELTSPHD